jgi:predicted deacylase
MKLVCDKIEAEQGTKSRGFVSFSAGVGSVVRIPVVLINGQKPGPVLGITGGVHAAEFSSIQAAIELSRETDPKKLTGALVVFPIVNIPAFEGIQERFNPLEWPGLFNSATQIPGDPDGTHTARFVNLVYTTMRKQCQYVIDLHGGEPSEWINYHAVLFPQVGDEKVDKMTVTMARCFPDARLVITKDPRSQFTGHEYPKKGIPYIVSEAGSAGFIQEEAVAFHKSGVLNFMRHLGMIEGKANLMPEPKKLPNFADDIKTITAPTGGIYYPAVKAGQKVAKDQLLATIKDAFGDTVNELRSPMRSVVMYIRTYPPVRPGDFIMQILSLDGTLKGLE